MFRTAPLAATSLCPFGAKDRTIGAGAQSRAGSGGRVQPTRPGAPANRAAAPVSRPALFRPIRSGFRFIRSTFRPPWNMLRTVWGVPRAARNASRAMGNTPRLNRGTLRADGRALPIRWNQVSQARRASGAGKAGPWSDPHGATVAA